MNRFFLHGRTGSPLLLKHLLAASCVVETVCFISSVPPTNTPGMAASAFENRRMARNLELRSEVEVHEPGIKEQREREVVAKRERERNGDWRVRVPCRE
ncbi:hypothetical protein GLYMA_18G210200v4 [Glycine max]|uniref:Secreted protein n=2 Tax=Glycine subgen. Soja TaxID=1462606 RepID=A0A0R0FAR0_SOYBN|nr:hypothetical protein GYH30_050652 [Glycine max]KAH1199448.1 hypothetical protein GmHk_18G052810 [Glycine max]KRH00386.1 hypothetical protein GLYMA_18G210200v4 [Glycine max]RZB52992.1 hypothetical protein D0Y65_049162 [Glycine soja]